MTYDLTITSNTDTDIQPEVAALESPMVATITGMDSHRVRVHLTASASAAEYEALLESDTSVRTYRAVSEIRTIQTSDRGREIWLEYTPDLAEKVKAIEAAAGEDSLIQGSQMVALFPGRPELHTTTSEYRALLAVGCVEQDGELG